MTTEKKIVIIGGCPRSGTTTLLRLLHEHPDFAIGMEQFHRGWDQKQMTRAAFSEEGLTRFHPDLSGEKSKDRMANWMTVEKYRAAKWVGDKVPLLHKTYENVDAEMPEAEILFIVRNPLSVMESYYRRHLDPNDKGWQGTPLDMLEDWNLSVSKALERINAGKPLRVLSYEKAFASREAISRIYAIFGSSISDANEDHITAVITRFRELQGKEGPRNELLRRLVSEKCAFGSYQTLVREHCIFTDLPLLRGQDRFIMFGEGEQIPVLHVSSLGKHKGNEIHALAGQGTGHVFYGPFLRLPAEPYEVRIDLRIADRRSPPFGLTSEVVLGDIFLDQKDVEEVNGDGTSTLTLEFSILQDQLDQHPDSRIEIRFWTAGLVECVIRSVTLSRRAGIGNF